MNAFSQPDEELVQVMVPKYMVTAVYRFIADHDRSVTSTAGGGAPPPQDEVRAEGGDGEGPWTVAELRRLAETGTETAVLVTAMMDHLSSYPDRRFSTSEMISIAGWDYNRFTGSLSAFSRHIVKAYGRVHWPFRFARVGGEGTYMLPAAVAVDWCEARSFGPDDSAAPNGRKDWSRIEKVLSLLPRGKWTTFGEVAAFDHTSPRAVARRMSTAPALTNAHRVLTAGGRVPEGFHWSDPQDTREVEQVLAEDGVVLVNHVALPANRLRADDLLRLIEG